MICWLLGGHWYAHRELMHLKQCVICHRMAEQYAEAVT